MDGGTSLWEVLTAIGTVAAALGTLGALIYLVRQASDSRRAADAAQRSADAAQQESAGAWRPMLVVLTYRLWHETNACVMRVTVENAGRGPALNVSGEVSDNAGVSLSSESQEGDVLARRSLLREGERLSLERLHEGAPYASYLVRFDYEDLGGRRYSTDVQLRRTPDDYDPIFDAVRPPVGLEIAAVEFPVGQRIVSSARQGLPPATRRPVD